MSSYFPSSCLTVALPNPSVLAVNIGCRLYSRLAKAFQHPGSHLSVQILVTSLQITACMHPFLNLFVPLVAPSATWELSTLSPLLRRLNILCTLD